MREYLPYAQVEGLKLAAELTLLARALFSLDVVTTSVDPMFNPSKTMRDYASNRQRARKARHVAATAV